MKLRKKCLSSVLSAAMVLSVFFVPANAEAADTKEARVADADLTDNNTAAPEAWGATPSPNQYRYQKEELAAFCHFGPNTFNEVEWGENYGNRAPADIFTLQQDFDAATMVRTLKEAGFKKLIVTAKHHDGFCIWASEFTTYDVASTNYKSGKGDVLAEISAACTEYNMDMGLYLSPWDIHEPSYGYYDANGQATSKENDVLDYNEYYNNQLEEILGNSKYGNNGHFVEVWMDGAKGSGANAQDYDFQTWFHTIQKHEGKAAGYDDDCMLFGAQAYTTVRWIGNELGLAAEETWSKSRTDKEANTIDSNKSGSYTKGFYDGNQWTVPEADARITSGWFWGNGKKTPKTIADLSNMYFNSVGHNATLLLNIPPNNQGKVDQAILDRVTEFGQNIRDSFADNLAKDATISASAVRGNAKAFSPAKVTDGDQDTYWTMDDGQTTGSLTLELGGIKTFDMVTIEEAIQLGQRISGFRVEYRQGNEEWKEFASGTTIGAKRICRNKAVKADQVRISITSSYAVPLISEAGVYKATEGFEIASPIPDDLRQVGVTDKNTDDGFGWTYTGWNAESGTQFISGNGIWAGSGKEATLTFTGTKVWLYGTKDPGHGTADIYIDGTRVTSINTKSSPRATGQIIFESDTLQSGNHTLRIVNTGTIGIDTAAVLDNGGAGMVQFDTKRLEMEENSVKKLLVRRVGGSTGEIRVTYENNPGSAVQGNYDVDGIKGELVFADGETEKEIAVTTKRDIGYKGDLDFTVDLVSITGNGILGSSSVKVIIRDMDDAGRIPEAEQLMEEVRTLVYDLYEREGQDEVKQLAAELEAYLGAKEIVRPADILRTASELKAAKEALVPMSTGPAGDTYTSEDRFVMPVGGAVKMTEAEWFILDASGAADANKYVRLTERADASNGKEVNWFENGNRIRLPFTAAKAGTYKVKATYRSGRAAGSPNAFEWSGTNVTPGSKDVYGETNATTFHTAEFDVAVTAAGAGELVFTAGTKGGPVIDKFEIISTEQAETVLVTGVTLSKTEAALTDENSYVFLKATVLPANATNKDVTFSSSDPSVAAVTDKGLVTAVPGAVNKTAVITVTTADGAKTAECRIKVGFAAEEEKGIKLEELQAKLKEIDSVIAAGKGKYTDASWNALINAYNSAKKANAETDADEIQTMLDGLKAAKEGLQIASGQPKPVPEQPGNKDQEIRQGQTYDSGNFSYKVTSTSDLTAEVVALKNKKISAIRIYNTVILGGKSYKITSVASSVFKNNKKIRSVTVGKNVKTIGSSAFAGCTSLTKVAINSKGLERIDSKVFNGCKKLGSIKIKSTSLKKVGKNAFKGIAKKAVIKVPVSKLEAYKKVLAKKGQSKTVKISR
ncbi:MAG: alpha-L-fucosidase [Lachnospiraceae bacterium]|nr:alpha-L-fucosidase [Lachnospiraceae bacterium]